MAVEQSRVRRGGVGLRALDRERSCPGYTLYSPMGGRGEVYLLDLDGAVAHQWRMPYPPGLYGYLTGDGRLFYNGQLPPMQARFGTWPVWKGGVVLEADWTGRVLWEVRHPDHHHDGRRLRNGNVILLCLKQLDETLAAKVQGGRAGARGPMFGDYLVEMTTKGETVWEWRSWEHLDPAADCITAPGEPRHEWTHGNTVAELDDGNLVVSFRDISTVAIIDRPSGDITWKLGAPPLAQQHAPTPLPNGNLLIFDNGTTRLDTPATFSRVIEVDPRTSEIVWTYMDRPPIDFYSPYISNAQRLDNGNTLICEGNFGRIFEVTHEGELVWEYINPHFGSPANQPDRAPANNVFRAFRYGVEQIERARAARAATRSRAPARSRAGRSASREPVSAARRSGRRSTAGPGPPRAG
jgi:hypothetical protein